MKNDTLTLLADAAWARQRERDRTDPELLAATGGIVQGMSGSPIVQDGRIAAVVTHVFVNEPNRGYGVYAFWMYSVACGEN